jgi:hypothetical protein
LLRYSHYWLRGIRLSTRGACETRGQKSGATWRRYTELFGIKGKRWENHEEISKLMNEHWIRPAQSETPANFAKVEDGCYW